MPDGPGEVGAGAASCGLASDDLRVGLRVGRVPGCRCRTTPDRPRKQDVEGDARPGERVVSRIAPGIATPCRVVYVIDEPSRRGFAYGTLPGHPESGEEAFIVEIDETDEVWFSVRPLPAQARSSPGSPGPSAAARSA